MLLFLQQRIVLLVGTLTLFLAFFFISPQVSVGAVFCSTGAGLAGCLSICQNPPHNYDGMTPGTAINGQLAGTAGYYCANGDDATITRTAAGEGMPSVVIPENIFPNEEAGKNNYIYLDSEVPSIVNVNVYASGKEGAATAMGRFMDSLFLMMNDFGKNILRGDFKKAFNSRDYFSMWRTSEVVEDDFGEEPDVVFDPATGLAVCLSTQTFACAEACGVEVSDLVPIDGEGTYAGYGGYYCTEVYSVSPGDDTPDDGQPGTTIEFQQGVTNKNLYCEVDQGVSVAVQTAQIESCVSKSDLSSEEKFEVLRAVKLRN